MSLCVMCVVRECVCGACDAYGVRVCVLCVGVFRKKNVWGRLGGVLGTSWGHLGASGGVLGVSQGVLDASRGVLGTSGSVLGASRGLKGVWERPGGVVAGSGMSWIVLGASEMVLLAF